MIQRKTGRALATTALALLLGAGIVAMQPKGAMAEPQRGGTVQLAVTPEPPSLMMGLFQNGPTQMIAGNIYESLLRYDQDLTPQPSLAESWEISDDELTYTFKLRENATWHDGEPFTADDVVFSLDVFLREVHPRWRPTANAQIESIEKTGDHEVTITLKQPFAPLILSFEAATAPIIPRHIYEGTDYRNNPMNATPIGTGPMKFVEWESGSFVHLTRNENYYLEGRPYIDDVYYRFIPDAASRAVAFETGSIDVLTGGSVEIFDVPRLERQDNVCVTTDGWELFAPHAWLALNVREGVLAERSFRQAMMHAIDREFARDVVWSGFGTVANSPISSRTLFHSTDLPEYAFDPDRARELIAESGYNGETLELLVLPYGETWTRWAEATRQNLEDVGINVSLVTTDVAGWSERVGSFNFQMTHNFLYQFGDPALGVARSYVSSNIVQGNPFSNVMGFANDEVDRLFAAAANAPSDERAALYQQVQEILVEELPVLWMIEMDFPTVYRCNLQDFITTAIGVNDAFRDAWLKQ
ncbi:MAG: ABC transporter substrate-binding protein [Salinarimonas sp.]